MALLEEGYTNSENFKISTRKGLYAYFLTPMSIREKYLLTHSFIKRKREEFDLLKAEIKALQEEAGLVAEATPSQRDNNQ